MGTFTGLELHPDVVPGIKALSRSAELLTLSNGPSAAARSLPHRGGVEGLFAHFLSFQPAPRWEPSPGAYGARQSQDRAEELMLVAVHPWVIHGANAAAWRTTWINRT
ncbi:hypothetical protein [Nesterenkonia sp. Act20]|uniref:hypothetical protein n=1 Tax=Nesterenkonia sp. Act20 TaxID=1483432 RepID=UPI001C46E46E|nr:hypothetical protein [Nesterenkonia sp. Act20]